MPKSNSDKIQLSEGCQKAMKIASIEGRRVGLSGPELEDASSEFVLWLLTIPDHRVRLSDQSLNWYAHKHFLDVLRSKYRRGHREMSWSNLKEGVPNPVNHTGANPEEWTIRRQVLERIMKIVERLTSEQSDLFFRFYVEEESMETIAAATGRTPQALRQAKSVIKKHIMRDLNRNGIDEP